MSTFSELGLIPAIQSALTELGYEKPTEIQQKAIPEVISSKNDIKAFAQTGTGKTAAFSLPILSLVDCDDKNVQAIILSPTRELAVQIGKNIEDFAKNLKGFKTLTIYGGTNIEEQMRHLKRGPQIVVGTPGRTVDLIKRKALKLKNIKWVVLDEADEMLNMGFKEDLDKVLEVTPKEKQTLLFSATFPQEVEAISRNYMSNPTEIVAGQKNTGSDNISNEYYLVSERNRYPALKRIVDLHANIYAIIFCRTRRETQQVADKLINDGYNADSLHGDLSQAQRDSVMQKFRNRNLQILVATDVAARGLDVDILTHVINYKIPDQVETYTHRSGRTGRAGNKGVAITLISVKEQGRLKPIERKIGKQFIKREVPSGEEVCKSQLFNLIEKVKQTSVNEAQINPYLDTIYKDLEALDREELIRKFVSIEFNRFLAYYENANNLNDTASHRNGAIENMTRFFINIGRKDHVTPTKLIGLINDQKIGNNINIGSIEILDTFSFFELDQNFTDETLEAFSNCQFQGRNISVEITKKPKAGRNGKKKFRSPVSSGFGRHKANVSHSSRKKRKKFDD